MKPIWWLSFADSMKRSKGKHVNTLEVYREDAVVRVWSYATCALLQPSEARELAAILIKAAKKCERA